MTERLRIGTFPNSQAFFFHKPPFWRTCGKSAGAAFLLKRSNSPLVYGQPFAEFPDEQK